VLEQPTWPPAWLDAPVPARLPAAAYRGPVVEAAADRILVRVPPVGRFLAQRHGPVLVDRVAGATDADVTCFLGGPVGAAALLLRGRLTLRAAAVSVAGSGVLICGSPAAGKSVLAAALAQRGHRVLADRVGLVVGPVPTVVPVDPQVQLWPDAVGLLGLAAAAGRVVRPVLARRAFQLGPAARPAPLRLLVLLRQETRVSLGLAEPAGPGAAANRFAALLGLEWHRRLVGPLGREADRFSWLAGLARAGRVVLVGGQRQAPPAELAARVEGLLR
jgi:hypothetical protein